MEQKYFINQIVWFHSNVFAFNPPKIYSQKTYGTIKGIKTNFKNSKLYLIEFFNHNRIWIIDREFK